MRLDFHIKTIFLTLLLSLVIYAICICLNSFDILHFEFAYGGALIFAFLVMVLYCTLQSVRKANKETKLIEMLVKLQENVDYMQRIFSNSVDKALKNVPEEYKDERCEKSIMLYYNKGVTEPSVVLDAMKRNIIANGVYNNLHAIAHMGYLLNYVLHYKEGAVTCCMIFILESGIKDKFSSKLIYRWMVDDPSLYTAIFNDDGSVKV